MSETRPQPPIGASLVGEVLGNYRILGELSSGGMGTVYRAQHELLGRPAAIKLLRPELSSNNVLVQRFFNEAKAATAIRHPGIVEVYDFGYTHDGLAYLVMELLDGEPLSARLERRGRLTELEVASIARGIASALKAAHAKGIVHRDLKPDNVFLVPDPEGTGDRVKVLDFGVAKLTDDAPTNVRHTQTGALMGTPLYMAPEQARAAGEIDHRADLYSLGCILYELLVGKPPFVADGAGEIIALQMFGEVQPPKERLAELTPEMNAIVMRLLEKEPHARYQHAADLIQALAGLGGKLSSQLSAERPATERPPMISPTPMPGAANSLRLSLIDERPPPEKRSSLPIIAGVLTVLLAGAGTIFFLTRSGGDEPAKANATTPPPRDETRPPPPAPPPEKTTKPQPPPVKQVEDAKQPEDAKKDPKPAKRTPKIGGTKTSPTAPDTAGPVVKPGTEDTPASAATTHPGMHTTEGAPIEPDLGPTPKKPDPPKDP